MTETWDAMDTPAAVTSYLVEQSASPRRIEVTYPDGTRRVQLAYNTPGQFTDGLVYQVETYDPGNKLLQKTAFTWEQGAYGAPRVKRTEVTDELNQTAATEYVYGTNYNQVAEVLEYDYGTGSSVLRKVRTEYETAIEYLQRHIYNLPKVVEIYQYSISWLPNRAWRTEYTYDGQTLANTPGIVQHQDAFNPYASSGYDPITDYRGNVTQVKTYADAANLGGAIVEMRRYDIAGNLVTVSGTSCCEQISFSYTSATQYAYLTALTRGAANPASPARVTTTATYDFNTGLALSSTDANGRTTQMAYDATTLRPQMVTWSTGAATNYTYDDAALKVTATTVDWYGFIGRQTVAQLNGLGLVRRTEVLAEGGLWDVVETKYDKLGRLWKQSRPFRSGETPQWGEVTYDALGRVTQVSAPDGSQVHTYYNETTRPSAASYLLGQMVRTVDAWGRERWAQTNALGQLMQVVEPNPNGSGSVFDAGAIRTRYTYDALDQVVSVLQGPLPGQGRAFRYDSLGRLTHQRLPEKNGTLSDAGVYNGPGAYWTDIFTYDARSNLTSHTDARGVKTIYDYGNDPLNRLQSVTYDLSGFGDTANRIAPAPTVTYEYMATGDVTRLWRVTTAGVATEEYGYDSEGRLSSKKLMPAGWSSNPFTTDYLYDSLHRLWEIT